MTGKDGKKPRKRPPETPPRGRPPRHQGERLSKNRTFRVRGGLDEKLQAAAAVSGRSVSEEIEFRLDQSFDRDVEETKINSSFAQISEKIERIKSQLVGQGKILTRMIGKQTAETNDFRDAMANELREAMRTTKTPGSDGETK